MQSRQYRSLCAVSSGGKRQKPAADTMEAVIVSVDATTAASTLIAMGTPAMRHAIELSNTSIDVNISLTGKPVMRFQVIDIEVKMPVGLFAEDRNKLERAAEGCPIEHGFSAGIPITVNYLCLD